MLGGKEKYRYGFNSEDPDERERSIKAMPQLYDIYRTEPDESHRWRIKEGVRIRCATLMIWNNHDLRNYLVVPHDIKPADLIPPDKLVGYDLWIKKAPKEATLLFFDLEYSDAARTSRVEFKNNNCMFVRNTMAREWDESLVRQDNVDYVNALTQEQLEYNSREFGMAVEKYLSWMRNNHLWRVRGYLENMDPGEHMRLVHERQRVLNEKLERDFAMLDAVEDADSP